MKKSKEKLFRNLFVISLICSFLLSYFLYENLRPVPKIMRFGFGEHNIEVYCETSEDVKVVTVDHIDRRYKIGKSELHSRKDLYLVTPEGEINLSEIGGEAFVINSEGELLYQMAKTENVSEKKENIGTVYVTPSGKKYHNDFSCAGNSAFETETETAVLFGRAPCSICYSK